MILLGMHLHPKGHAHHKGAPELVDYVTYRHGQVLIHKYNSIPIPCSDARPAYAVFVCRDRRIHTINEGSPLQFDNICSLVMQSYRKHD